MDWRGSQFGLGFSQIFHVSLLGGSGPGGTRSPGGKATGRLLYSVSPCCQTPLRGTFAKSGQMVSESPGMAVVLGLLHGPFSRTSP